MTRELKRTLKDDPLRRGLARPRGDDEDDDDNGEEKEKSSGPEDRMMEKFLKARTILISEAITSELARRVYQNLILLEADDGWWRRKRELGRLRRPSLGAAR